MLNQILPALHHLHCLPRVHCPGHRQALNPITSSSSKNIPAVLPKPLHECNLEDCCDFLTSIQLEEYIPIFVQNKIDGIFMSCLAHEQIGLQLLNNLGITDHAQVKTVIDIYSVWFMVVVIRTDNYK